MVAPGSAKSTTSFDMEAKIALPSGKAVSFVAAILASSLSNAEVLLQVNVSAPAGAGADRVVNASLGVVGATRKQATLNSTLSFQLPDAPTLSLRVLADRSIVETCIVR